MLGCMIEDMILGVLEDVLLAGVCVRGCVVLLLWYLIWVGTVAAGGGGGGGVHPHSAVGGHFCVAPVDGLGELVVAQEDALHLLRLGLQSGQVWTKGGTRGRVRVRVRGGVRRCVRRCVRGGVRV